MAVKEEGYSQSSQSRRGHLERAVDRGRKVGSPAPPRAAGEAETRLQAVLAAALAGDAEGNVRWRAELRAWVETRLPHDEVPARRVRREIGEAFLARLTPEALAEVRSLTPEARIVYLETLLDDLLAQSRSRTEPAAAAEEAALIARARGGDGRATEALLTRFRPLLSGTMAQCREIPYEERRAFVEAEFCLLLAAYDPGRGVPFRRYLGAMLRERVRGLVREHRCYHRRFVLRAEMASGAEDADGEDGEEGGASFDRRVEAAAIWHDAGRTPEELAIIRDWVREHLAWLPEKTRRALQRRADGYTYPEIAAESGEAVNTCEQQVHRGVEKLGKWWRKDSE